MAKGTRYSQSIQNLARERGHGMVKLAYDGRYLATEKDRVSVSLEGPACPIRFELVRKFLWAFTALPPLTSQDGEIRKAIAGKLREIAEEFEK